MQEESSKQTEEVQEPQQKEKTQVFSTFINDLRTEYTRLRSVLKTDISDDELLSNEDFKKCFKITYIMTTALSSQDGLQSLFVLADNFNFDIEKLLESFDVVKVEGQQYPTIVEKNADTES